MRVKLTSMRIIIPHFLHSPVATAIRADDIPNTIMNFDDGIRHGIVLSHFTNRSVALLWLLLLSSLLSMHTS